jgi:hypothetical protein
VPFGLVTRAYLDQRLDDLRREVERGRVTEDRVHELMAEAWQEIQLEWGLWQRKFMNLLAQLSKKAKRAEPEPEDAPGDTNGEGGVREAPPAPAHPRRYLRGF